MNRSLAASVVCLVVAACAATDEESERASDPYGDGLLGRVYIDIPFDIVSSDGREPGSLYVIIEGTPLEEPILPDVPNPTVYRENSGRVAQPVWWVPVDRAVADQLPYSADPCRFYVPQTDEQMLIVTDSLVACQEACTLRLFYTSQQLDHTRDRTRFWEESPELWQTAELEYSPAVLAERVALIDYDAETGYGRLTVSVVEVQVGDSGLQVSLQPREVQAYNIAFRPLDAPPPDDAGMRTE
jgi:hypothetical protein